MTRAADDKKPAADKKKAPPPLPDLSRDQILAIDDYQLIPVDVPEWGGKVYIRTLTAGERDEIEARAFDLRQAGEPTNAHATVVARCACDAQGNPLFSLDDVPVLAKKASRPMNRIFTAADKLNFARGDLKELEGN